MKRLLVLMAIVSVLGCAGPEKQLKMTEGGASADGSQPAAAARTIVFPNGTIVGGASAAQVTTLAEIFVDSHNSAMMQMDQAAKSLSDGQRQIQISTLRIEESVEESGNGEAEPVFDRADFQKAGQRRDHAFLRQKVGPVGFSGNGEAGRLSRLSFPGEPGAEGFHHLDRQRLVHREPEKEPQTGAAEGRIPPVDDRKIPGQHPA